MHVCTNRYTINSVRLHDVSITRQLNALIYHRSFWIFVKCLAFWWLICAMSYFRVFGAKGEKAIWRVFAWRPFAPPGKETQTGAKTYLLYTHILKMHTFHFFITCIFPKSTSSQNYQKAYCCVLSTRPGNLSLNEASALKMEKTSYNEKLTLTF